MSRPVSALSRRTAMLASAALLSVGIMAGAGIGSFSGNSAAIAQAARSLAGPPSFASIVEDVKPAVVSVRVRARAEAMSGELPDGVPPGMERFFRRFGEEGPRGGRPPIRMSQGSGFFISADGFAVTNNHVIEGATQVELVMDNGRTVSARVVGRDPRTDIALLKAEEGGNFPFVRLSRANPRIGDWIIAVGNPFGLGGTVTAGIVSAAGRDIGAGPYDDFLQIDAPVNRGNSGGPTFNTAGEVVGVNTAIVSPSGGNVGIAFAVPAATVERVVADLRAKGSVTRGFIGVQIQPVTAELADAIGLREARGALVAEAQPEGPAARAGLRRGDTILAIEGRPIRDARELSRRIADVQPGDRITVTVFREGRERTITIEVGRQPAA